VILPGAVIERGCTIAAGAVVRGHCLAGKTYGGVPARLLTSSKKENGAKGTSESPTLSPAKAHKNLATATSAHSADDLALGAWTDRSLA
jgi:carbonic anhydrase/acetyltransferase-like protein (isoleucine patch superfamily)